MPNMATQQHTVQHDSTRFGGRHVSAPTGGPVPRNQCPGRRHALPLLPRSARFALSLSLSYSGFRFGGPSQDNPRATWTTCWIDYPIYHLGMCLPPSDGISHGLPRGCAVLFGLLETTTLKLSDGVLRKPQRAAIAFLAMCSVLFGSPAAVFRGA
ncbi:hypothetical protein BDP81DRAFT_417531 [Colletotrichum phormii]|uniref:Uncharacterized protein n=1 Tax=Colletotrichum phormii TaxID=359342 RepID=A0AAJ0EHU5_9PEZI|nr:uncharacterized protein BDP81DRAFT_417531 [Colletotrichum phormii]KAK1640852.1 hypothetical protein BDP81DRAFT_417531 [Colletotrichum phormii]